jgi:hypothetical protein
MSRVALALLLLIIEAPAPTAPLEYRFDEVKSKVVVTHQKVETRAAKGATALAGDGVRTGMFAKATLSVPVRASRFEIASSTRVTLAGPEPGVLIVLETGRLLAIFDALTGDTQRLVATPGALLAVRGTRYGVEVDADGAASLAVFEGVVEVLPIAGERPPVRVSAGEMCDFGPKAAPQPRPMPKDLTERGWASHGAPRDEPGREPPGGMRGPDGASSPHRQAPPGGPGNPKH